MGKLNGYQKDQAEPIYTYEDAIKRLVASDKAGEILNSDKAKLLSTPALTPEGNLSPEWAEHIAHQKALENE